MTYMRALLLTLFIGSTGCPGKIDQVTMKRILPAAINRGDIVETCQMGLSVSPIVAALGTPKRSPDKALLVTEVAGAICALTRAHEANLSEARFRSLFQGQANALPTLTDARIEKERAHTDTARRFGAVWSRFQKVYPIAGGQCPTLRQDEETVYVVGVLSGLLAVLHDGTGGRNAGISQDTVLHAGRAAQCLSNERWWGLPEAMNHAGWAAIPGSGPEGIDPWSELVRISDAASARGMRLPAALYVTIAANAGHTDKVKTAVTKAAESLTNVPSIDRWRLLDALAQLLLVHESDLVWFAEEGHRTEYFGTFPRTGEDMDAINENPFTEEADPFASDEE